MTFRALLALFVLGLPAHADEVGSQPGLLLMEWTLVSVDGVEVDYAATIDISLPGQLSGQGPCNRYFAVVEDSLPAFHPKDIGATKMACADMAAEVEYFQLLTGIETASQGPDALVLTGAGHEMRYVRPIN